MINDEDPCFTERFLTAWHCALYSQHSVSILSVLACLFYKQKRKRCACGNTHVNAIKLQKNLWLILKLLLFIYTGKADDFYNKNLSLLKMGDSLLWKFVQWSHLISNHSFIFFLSFLVLFLKKYLLTWWF